MVHMIRIAIILTLTATPAFACRMDMNAASVCTFPWYNSESNSKLNAIADECEPHAYRKIPIPSGWAVIWDDKHWERKCEPVRQRWLRLQKESWK